MSKRISIALAALLFAAVILTTPAGVFWITDAGNKCIQAQSIALSRFTHVSIAYPAASVDRGFEFFPTDAGRFQRKNGSCYSIAPFYFPWISAYLLRLFGFGGLRIIPFVSGVTLLLLVPRIMKRLKLSCSIPAAILFTALGTPIFFYSVVFWEHTLAVLLSTAAIVLILGKEELERRYAILLAAGALLGISTVFREEGYLLAAAIFGAYVATARAVRPLIAMVAGQSVVLAPVWILNRHLFGHPLGLHGTTYGTLGRSGAGALVQRMVRSAYVILLSADEQVMISILLAAPAVLLLGLAFMQGERIRRLRLVLLALVAICGLLWVARFVAAQDPVFRTAWTQGFFPALPFVALLLAGVRELLPAGGSGVRFVLIM